ncbi:MAG: UUP1 family membrane protein [Alphaproteobacteria bacterium]|nr:UUP1 family membrane protein [Alphaproteobacteria bacterium]
MKNFHPYVLSFVLIVIGLSIFYYKFEILGLPTSEQVDTKTWEVETRVSFEGDGRPTRVQIPVPVNAGQFTVIDQRFAARNYGMTTQTEGSNRYAIFSTSDAAGSQLLYLNFRVHRVPSRDPFVREATDPKPAKAPNLKGPKLIAAETLLESAQAKSADVQTLTSNLLANFIGTDLNDSARYFVDTNGSTEQVVKATVQILSIAGVPARVVNGIVLMASKRNVQTISWLEVFDDGYWKPFDPRSGEMGIPDHWLPWWRGSIPLVANGSKTVFDDSISVSEITETALSSALVPTAFAEPVLFFSLFSLPLSAQQIYKIMLVVPVGVLLLVILRNFIGLSTFGTFMPVLIALAFRETQLLWGITLFVVVVSIGLTFRIYLEHLKLLVIPRLGSVLILVVIVMSLLSVMSERLGLEKGVSIALFPLVIITMTIERMSIVWEEHGPPDAIKQAIGTLVAASLCYFVMNSSYLENLFFVFPELLITLLGVSIFLGRYTGLRLVELWRFREFGELK